MADMTTRLDPIANEYTVFEEDQVLTAGQLNGVVDYLGDQERLTRVDLVGVGVFCGLRVTLANNVVRLGKGVGVTTDGDVVRVAEARSFSFFRRYDDRAPVYPPMRSGDQHITSYELLESEPRDGGEQSGRLADFTAKTNLQLGAMSAVILVESVEKDEDLCTGTSCDNKGKRAIETVRLLVVDAAAAKQLLGRITTPDQVATKLDAVVANRALVWGVSSTQALAVAYRTACNAIHRALTRALPKLEKAGAFLWDADPTARWVAVLDAANSAFASSGSGIQYYYDFLKDVVETYTAVCEWLAGDTTVCVPAVNAFPKHLVLGALAAPARASEDRTGFYPSPIVSAATNRLAHARFLAGKLGALIETWRAPAVSTDPTSKALRVTPSLCEDSSLEDRAIPYYYDPRNAQAIHEKWNFSLYRRDMSKFNYSYHAPEYGAEGAAAAPLTSQLGRFTFFRVEGHLGKNVSEAVDAIEDQIRRNNLPFAVRSVLLHSDKQKIVKRPGRKVTDLHRLHDLVRHQVSSQLDDVVYFGQQLKKDVDREPDATEVVEAAKRSAGRRSAALEQKARKLQGSLAKGYSAWKADTAWRDDLKEVMGTGADYKYEIGEISRTDFVTPIDGLIANPQIQWLDWLDEVIEIKDSQDDERQLFTAFLKEHPGIEHFAGVVRGGTLVLVYDAAGAVIADFMLPYVCCEPPAAMEEPPQPKRPKLVLDNIRERGVRVKPPVDLNKFVDNKIVAYRDIQKDYFDVFQESFNTVKGVFDKGDLVKMPEFTVPGVDDSVLNMFIRDARVQEDKLDRTRKAAFDPGLSESERKTFDKEAQLAEEALAKAQGGIAARVAEKKMSVQPGTEGSKAVEVVVSGMQKLKSAKSLGTLKSSLEKAAGKAHEDVQETFGRMASKIGEIAKNTGEIG